MLTHDYEIEAQNIEAVIWILSKIGGLDEWIARISEFCGELKELWEVVASWEYQHWKDWGFLRLKYLSTAKATTQYTLAVKAILNRRDNFDHNIS